MVECMTTAHTARHGAFSVGPTLDQIQVLYGKCALCAVGQAGGRRKRHQAVLLVSRKLAPLWCSAFLLTIFSAWQPWGSGDDDFWRQSIVRPMTR